MASTTQKTKNSKQKVYSKLGYLDDLEKVYTDPIAHFKEEIFILNQKRKEKDVELNFTVLDKAKQ